MTYVSLCYLIVGMMALICPLTLILFRRRLMAGQWIMGAALLLFAIAMLLYSTLFNSFLKGEYLLVVLYMAFALATPPMTHIALTSLLHPQGISLRARAIFVPTLATIVILTAMVVIGGVDNFYRWVEQSAEGASKVFMVGQWRYNLIVATYYYLFTFMLLLEMLECVVYGVIMARRYRQTLREYYTNGMHHDEGVRQVLRGIIVIAVIVAIGYICCPFNVERPLWVAVGMAFLLSGALLFVGRHLFLLNYSAERLHRFHSMPHSDVRGSKQAGRALCEYIENERLFLNPDLSVPLIAQQMHMVEDDVVDLVYLMQGSSFGEYIDGLRIDYAITLLFAMPEFDPDEVEEVAMLAHRCGYLSSNAFEYSFSELLQCTLRQWCRMGGVRRRVR